MTLEKTLTELIKRSLIESIPDDILADIYLGNFLHDNYHTIRKIMRDSVKHARTLHDLNKQEEHDDLEDIVTEAVEEITAKCI